jgi:arginine exporter protein ArgO
MEKFLSEAMHVILITVLAVMAIVIFIVLGLYGILMIFEVLPISNISILIGGIACVLGMVLLSVVVASSEDQNT